MKKLSKKQQLNIGRSMWVLPDYSRCDHLTRFDPPHHRTRRTLPEFGINQNQNQSKT